MPTFLTRIIDRSTRLSTRRPTALAGALALIVLVSAVVVVRGGDSFLASAGQEAQHDLWFAPPGDVRPNALSTALTQLEDGKADDALPALKKASADTVVGRYVRLHQGQAELALGDAAGATASAAAVLSASPEGYLKESALWLKADAAEARADWVSAASVLTELTGMSLTAARTVQAHARLGAAAQNAGQYDVATRSFLRVHDDFPTSPEAINALASLKALSAGFQPVTAERATVALRRAQALYAARKYADAGRAFDAVRPHTKGDDRHLVDLRRAQIDAQLKRRTAALRALDTLIASKAVAPAVRDEAAYTRLGVLRDLGRLTHYIAAVRPFVDRSPDPVFAEAALNDLGTHYILTDEDAKSAEVFTEQYARYPDGPFGGRAAWKAGWWAFTNANYVETVRLFEDAAVRHRRADYRSGWVYWAARAHERLGEHDLAVRGYERTITDYGHSYYGREAVAALNHLHAATRATGSGAVQMVRRTSPVSLDPGEPPANAALIQSLLSAQLWDDAIGEIRRTQRVDGNSPTLEATLAYALHRNGDLRLAISAIKRAYPQYFADGVTLPRELLTVLFPLAHWDLIQKYSKAQKLDPFLVAALVAQESTFDEKIRSAANAWGLMQILPSTGQRYARTLKIRPFNTARLTQPEVNVRIGTTYFAELMKQFGDAAPALAAYNAGENRVVRWLAERPGLDRDEFIDGIPFPETQGYVKKILGTAEDYRILYETTPGR